VSPAERATREPEKKRSKLLGNIDLDSPEVQKLLNAKSAHANLLTEVRDLWFLLLVYSVEWCEGLTSHVVAGSF